MEISKCGCETRESAGLSLSARGRVNRRVPRNRSGAAVEAAGHGTGRLELPRFGGQIRLLKSEGRVGFELDGRDVIEVRVKPDEVVVVFDVVSNG